MMHTVPVTSEATHRLVDPSRAPRPVVATSASAKDRGFAVSATPLHWRALEKQSAAALRAHVAPRYRKIPPGLDPEHPLMGPHPTD